MNRLSFLKTLLALPFIRMIPKEKPQTSFVGSCLDHVVDSKAAITYTLKRDGVSYEIVTFNIGKGPVNLKHYSSFNSFDENLTKRS